MKCPACARKLTEIKVGAVALDVCQGGCGGVWFDAAELEKLNRSVPTGDTPLAEISRDESIVLDETPARECVRCRGAKLERKLFSLGTGVIMDCCGRCGGLWLDHGELAAIRAETHPPPLPVQHVVKRHAASRSIKVTFEVMQQVQHLRIKR